MDEDNLSVSVLDGVATLSGQVYTLSERWTAAKNAYEGGGRRVRNRLKVINGPPYLRP